MNLVQIKAILRDHVSLIRNLLPDLEVRSIYDSDVYTDIFIDDLEFFNKNTPKGKLLDFGCGRGSTSVVLAQMGFDVVGMDVADPLEDNKKTSYVFSESIQKKVWDETEKLDSNLSFKFYDGNRIPYEDEAFDSVFAYAVLEHVEDIEYSLSEIYRVLRPGGSLFISRTPNKHSYLEKMADKLKLPAHDNRYTKKEILRILKDSNFFVDDFELIDFFPALIPGGGKINDYYQKGSSGLLIFDKIIRLTPLRYLSHHYRILARK